ncbi:MAG: linear amide C-N hydrolase [Muribaculaceae bacterium]
MRLIAMALAGALTLAATDNSMACSRVVMITDSARIVMVGRTLDWRSPIPTNLYVYPRGLSKWSMPQGPRLQWQARYGSVLAVSYDGGVTEGLNEAGLVMNGLFCNATQYRRAADTDGADTPVMSLSLIVSFFLDNFATVAEVEAWLADNDFAIAGSDFDGGTSTLLHWALTDAGGDTLIMEYVGGHLTTYRGKQHTVLTNNPIYSDMQAIKTYWGDVGGENMLPGTVRSADRFVRASYFIGHVPHNVGHSDALASLSAIMGTVSVPWGYTLEGKPHLSSTQWRSIADAAASRYYMRFADSISDFYIDLNGLPLTPDSPILKLDTSARDNLSGCVNDMLVESAGFTPIW